jgi:hypothetical protein
VYRNRRCLSWGSQPTGICEAEVRIESDLYRCQANHPTLQYPIKESGQVIDPCDDRTPLLGTVEVVNSFMFMGTGARADQNWFCHSA